MTEGGTSVCRVSLKDTVCIPPGNEMLLGGKILKKDRGFQNTGTFLFEPKRRIGVGEKVCAAHTLTEGKNTCILRVMNLSKEPVTVYKNTTMGHLTPISCEASGSPLEQQLAAPGELCDLNSALERQFAAPGTSGHFPIEHCANTCDLEQQMAAPSMFNIDKDLDSGKKERLTKLLQKYDDVFSKSPSDIGRTGLVKLSINTGNNTPIKQRTRPVPFHRLAEVKDLVEDMVQNAFARPSNSPWSSPIVLVKKKDNSTRFCVDYRRVNEITRKDAYPIPRIEETFDLLAGAKYFSCVDLASGYWQVELEEEDKEKTAFSTPFDLYEFNVMPFGLTGAPSMFQRLMECVLKGLQFEICLIYLDDVVIFSSTFDEHLERLELVLKRFRENGLKLKPSKCTFGGKKVQCLGHIISDERIETDPDKIDKVRS